MQMMLMHLLVRRQYGLRKTMYIAAWKSITEIDGNILMEFCSLIRHINFLLIVIIIFFFFEK